MEMTVFPSYSTPSPPREPKFPKKLAVTYDRAHPFEYETPDRSAQAE